MIRTIHAIDALVLHDGDRVFSPFDPIFPATDGGTRPAAFTSDRVGQALLELELELETAGTYQLVGMLAGSRVPLFRGEARARNPGVVTVEVALDATPTEVAALFEREIRWQVSRRDSDEPVAEQTLAMELYFVRRAPDTRFRAGLSLFILRETSRLFDESGYFTVSPAGFGYAGDLVSEVVRWLFFRNPPSYDIWSGAPHFCDVQDFNAIVLFLGAYRAAYSDPAALCNCYDMASLVQYYLETLGYGPIAWAFMEPFGYLRLTLLVGRGSNNNPIYGSWGGTPVVPCQDPGRSYFGNHSFCYLGWSGTIADACSGPHLGDESVAEYVDEAVDDCFPVPPRTRPGTVADITYWRGVTTVIRTTPVTQDPPIANLEFFLEAVGYRSPEASEGEAMAPLAVRWPDPLECPELGGWSLAWAEITPGYPEVSEQWRLRRGDDLLVLTVYAASDGEATAHRRFKTIVSLHSNPDPVYRRGPRDLGQMSAQSPDGRRLLWLDRTVVVSLESRSPTIDLLAVARWLQEFIEQGDPRGEPPRVGGLGVAEQYPLGAQIDVMVQCRQDELVRYAGGNPTLRLVGEEDRRLSFQAVAEGEGELKVVVVDRSTLLSTLVTRTVRVVE